MTIFHYQHQDSTVSVKIDPDADGYQVTIGNKTYRVVQHNQAAHCIDFSVDGAYKQVRFSSDSASDERKMWFAGQQWQLAKVDPHRESRRANAQAESGALTASMPGQVQEIVVGVGSTVQKGDTLLVLEAMKMEMRVNAPIDGVVASIDCAIGDVVARGQALVVLT